MDETKRVSLEKKLSHLKRYLLLAQIAECYSVDKKAVRALNTVTKRELRALKRSRFPMEDADLQQLYNSIGMLGQILKKFSGARRYDVYRNAEEQLTNYINSMTRQVAETEELLRTKPTVSKTIDSAVTKAKELGDVIGKGVEQLKKTVKDLSSK